MAGGNRTKPRWALLTLFVLIGASSACAKVSVTSNDSSTTEDSSSVMGGVDCCSNPYAESSSTETYPSETVLSDTYPTTDVTYPTTSDPLGSSPTDLSGVPAAPTETRNGFEVILADGVSRPINTTCFTTTDLVIPADWEMLISPEGCSFAFQGPQADQAVIAGELWQSSTGRSYEEISGQVISNLEAGTEPDVITLGPLNYQFREGPLTITNRWEGDTPQRWVIVEHTTNRHESEQTYTAVVEVPPSEESATYAIIIWATIPAENSQFFFDFVEGLTAF